MKKVLILLGVFTLFTFSVFAENNDTTPLFTVVEEPGTEVFYTVKSGDIIELSYLIQNLDESRVIDLELDLQSSDELGYSSSALSTTNLTLEPNTNESINFVIEIPESIEIGDYLLGLYSTLVSYSNLEVDEAGNTSVNVNVAVGKKIRINVVDDLEDVLENNIEEESVIDDGIVDSLEQKKYSVAELFNYLSSNIDIVLLLLIFLMLFRINFKEDKKKRKKKK